jgi:putative endonuclease
MISICTKNLGKIAENKIVDFLKNKNWDILEKNFIFHQKYGEIDIIAKKEKIITFIEVKFRKKDFATIDELVNKSKKKKIITTAEFFLQKNNILQLDYIIRFDIAYLNHEYKIFYYENAFTKEN